MPSSIGFNDQGKQGNTPIKNTNNLKNNVYFSPDFKGDCYENIKNDSIINYLDKNSDKIDQK
jgi:hypothetical protein